MSEEEPETVGSAVAAGVTKEDIKAASQMLTKVADANYEEYGRESEWTRVTRIVLSQLIEAWDTEVQPDE